jgi:hypothetical protein
VPDGTHGGAYIPVHEPPNSDANRVVLPEVMIAPTMPRIGLLEALSEEIVSMSNCEADGIQVALARPVMLTPTEVQQVGGGIVVGPLCWPRVPDPSDPVPPYPVPPTGPGEPPYPLPPTGPGPYPGPLP